ncbi:hypothetical protein [Amycolatopsis alba]|uniref:Uncharacterized protein n=1 Tax=Amycolatopsis alba DSM 44262 TaxID=1125972 RepID=A0A229R780_AMYAL|nr:hypothetical protein [Amycolatopsis alba]OXM42532.1 hypothetical protein CFP75_42295 [Amycolatopsis alba DSM 44262]
MSEGGDRASELAKELFAAGAAGYYETVSKLGHRAELAANDTTSTVGQGFTLSSDQAHAALEDVNGFLIRLGQMKLSAKTLQRLEPPAQDVVSVEYNGKLTGGSLDALTPWTSAAAFDKAVQQIDDEIRYLETLRKKLRKALGMTTETDADNKTAINRVGADTETQGGMAG